MEVSGEQVKLHLNIDKTQEQGKAAWFRYAPPTGNIMYSMPIVETSANLYFPNERNEEPIVIGCVRKNGSSCEKFSDVNNRYFSTESGNNLDMLPDAINFSRPGISANFNDGSGITLKSSSLLSINAGYVGMFAGNISITGTKKFNAKKGASIISLENDFYNNADIVKENGSDRASNKPFEDDPQKGANEIVTEIEAAVKAAIGIIASAGQGAIGKVGNIINTLNSLKSSISSTNKKPVLESQSRKNKDNSMGNSNDILNNKSFVNFDTNIKKYENESYITHDDGNSIPVDSIKVFSSSEQYNVGEKLRVKGYDKNWYTGTAQLDGYIGTGGYRKFKFEPDDAEAYNKGMSVENTDLYKVCNDEMFRESVDFIQGFTPTDIYVDAISFINGKDIITGEECNRGILAACIFLPGVLDKGLKCAAKHGDDLAKDVVKYFDDIKGDNKAIDGISNINKYGIDPSRLKLTNTAQNHINDVLKKDKIIKISEDNFSDNVERIGKDGYKTRFYKGDSSRPYVEQGTTLLADEIMKAGKPIPDPGGIPNGLRWDVPGSFGGKEGVWELVVDKDNNTIVHFLFNSK